MRNQRAGLVLDIDNVPTQRFLFALTACRWCIRVVGDDRFSCCGFRGTNDEGNRLAFERPVAPSLGIKIAELNCGNGIQSLVLRNEHLLKGFR